MRRDRRRRVSVRFLAGAIVLLAVQLQADQSNQRPTFRASVDLVRVDVSVLDNDRRPVSGLRAEDFTILVDGTPQQITSFTPVIAAPAELSRTPWGARVFSDVRTNGLRDPRLFVIVMDDASTEADPYQIQTAKAVAKAFIERLGPEDLASVIFTHGYNRRNAQELTYDRTKLLQAVEAFSFGPTGGPGRWMSRRTLRDVLRFLHEIPETRSSVVFISPAMDDTLLGVDATTDGLVTEGDLAHESTGKALARVPIYWFDTRGLEAPGLVRRNVDALPPSTVGPEFAMNTRRLQGPAFIDESGGRSIMRTNAPADEVPAVFEESQLYYLLGYRPTYPNDGKVRRVQIRVNRPGVQVFPGTRIVRPSNSRARPTQTRSDVLSGAIADLLPQPGLPLDMITAVYASPDKNRRLQPALCVNVGVRRPAPTEAIEERVQLVGGVFTLSGKKVASVEREVTLKLLPTGVESRFELLSRIDLKPGRYLVRFAVNSQTLGTSGSVHSDVTIPDVQGAGLALSDLAIVASPRPKAAPAEAFAAVIPVLSTTQRVFTRSHKVSAFVRVYRKDRSSADLDVALSLLDAQGGEVTLRRERFTAAELGDRRYIDIEVTLPLETASAGPHLISVLATSGVLVARRETQIILH